MDSNKVHAQPEQGLTEEQVEKAAITLWQIFGMVRLQTWGDLAEGSKEVYRERTKIFAPYLQFTPAQLLGDVIEGMCRAHLQKTPNAVVWRNLSEARKNYWRTVMSAGLGAALARPEVLGYPTEAENDAWNEVLDRDENYTMWLLDRRRDSLLKPAERTLPEELKDLLFTAPMSPSIEQVDHVNNAVLEAFNRGRRTSGGTK